MKGNESNVIAIKHTDFVNVLLLKVGGNNMIEDFLIIFKHNIYVIFTILYIQNFESKNI